MVTRRSYTWTRTKGDDCYAEPAGEREVDLSEFSLRVVPDL
jgi:hypothetical protein